METIAVLHVEDDLAFADLVATFLAQEDERFSIFHAQSPRDGMDILEERTIDCVISDYDMPEQNGIAFLKEVRDNDPALPFILFTGKGSEEVAGEAISSGVTDYLQKESGTEQYTILANRITNAVEQTRAAIESDRIRTRMDMALQHTDSLVFEINLETGRAIHHGEYADVFSIDPETIPSWREHLTKAVHPADQDAFESFYTGFMTGDRVEGFLTYRTHPDNGPVKWIEDAVHREQAPVTGHQIAVGIAHDITAYKERERALHRNERRYNALFNDPHWLVALIEPDGTVIEINETAMTYVDDSFAAVEGTKLWNTPWFSQSQDVTPHVKEYVSQAANGDYVAFDVDLLRSDGTPYVLEGVFRPVLTDAGDVVSILISTRDITENRQRERELKSTTTLQSSLLKAIPVGILAEDESRNVLAINQRMFDLFDMPGSPEQLIGADCAHLAEQASNMFVDAGAFLDGIEELLAGGSLDGPETFSLVDGRTFERTYRPLDLPDGTGHLWVYQDSTERKRREQQLRQQATELAKLTERLEQQYVTLFEEAPVMTVVTREEQGAPIIEECNRQFLETLGYDSDDVLGEPLGDFYARESRMILLDDGGYERSLNGEFTREHRDLLTADGTIVQSMLRAVPRENTDGDVIGTLAMYIDISEREQIKRANERLEEFTSVVSHDLRNPLNVATGRLALAMEETTNTHLEAIEEAHSRMAALIEDLLTLAREGDMRTNPEPIAIAQLIESCWKTVDTQSATLCIEVDGTIEADQSRVKQVFENLFRNAVEHGGDGVTVTVGTLDTGFFVEDDGPGIPEEKRQNIFDAGFSTKADGTGFGLRIVQQIVDAHGWTMYCTAGTSGGARFEIRNVRFLLNDQ